MILDPCYPCSPRRSLVQRRVIRAIRVIRGLPRRTLGGGG